MPPTPQRTDRLLRVGLALCFIGHGAFGLITKAAWLPYFELFGIPAELGWKLMPWVGGSDIALALVVLAWPCRALLIWMAFWTVFTALLRPLVGEGWAEFFERAGNYGLPLALLALHGWRGPWFSRLAPPTAITETAQAALAWVLRLATATLLAGHAACVLANHKAALLRHHTAAFGAQGEVTFLATGVINLVLAAAVLLRPRPALLWVVAIWKFASELLFLSAGVTAPVFEVIERAGSYTLPVVFALLLRASRSERAR
jgi:hypothetical protein